MRKLLVPAALSLAVAPLAVHAEGTDAVPPLSRVYAIRLVSAKVPKAEVNWGAVPPTKKTRFWAATSKDVNPIHSLRAFARWNGKVVDLGDVEEFKNRVFGPPRMAKPNPQAHGGYGTAPVAMNYLGQVVGDMSIGDGCCISQGAFFYDGKMHDLQTLVPRESGWVVNEVTSINDKGEITGVGNKGVFSLYPVSASARDKG